MAKKHKKGIEFYGTSELLNKIEAMGKSVDEAITKSLRASLKVPYEDMKTFAEQHVETGDMLNSLQMSDPIEKNGKIIAKVGFSIKDGGLPALFLNYGTPKIAPTFFIDKAFDDNVDEIKRLQLEALKEILRS